MFLHTSTLKKLLKKAFNSYGLTVAHFDEQIYLQGSSWAISLDENHIPNKVKGAIIELCGIIPDDGEVFRATKEGIQYEIPWSDIYNLRDQFKQAKLPLTKTLIIVAKSWNSYDLFQFNQSKDLQAVNKELTDLIDIREINTEVEGLPSGPCCILPNSSMLLWNNATCTLALCTSNLKEEKDIEIMNLLKKIDFEKED